jgi:hypothetical protein
MPMLVLGVVLGGVGRPLENPAGAVRLEIDS